MADPKPPSGHPSDSDSDKTDDDAKTLEGKPSGFDGENRKLGDFELLKEVGRGGMGIVYAARQISLNRQVALKILPPGIGMTEDSVKRFRREAQTAAKLHHTNIVPVYAIGEEEGSYYYAMELVEGEALNDILKDLRKGSASPLLEATVDQHAGKLAPKTHEGSGVETSSSHLSESSAGTRVWFDGVAKLLADVADALHYAHGQGVIHRDIKPANLMLNKDGRLCITDFGLARVAQEPSMTMSGSFLGTPAYMSPEQIAAGRITVDHRSDIYSLGAVLYEMLTYERPFPGENREEILTGIMTRDPRNPRRVNPRIPMDLETICLKALEKDPGRRYQNADEMAHDLRQYLSRGLITARRAGVFRRAGKFARRHPASVTASIAAVVLVLGIGGAVQFLSGQKANEAALRGVADAKYMLSQGEYERGLVAVADAIEQDSELVEARLVRARLLINLDRIQDAVEEAETVLATDPGDWSAHLIMAMAAKRGNQPTISAEEHMKAVEAKAPESADAYYLRSLMNTSSRESVELLNKALELDPSHVEALEERVYRNEDLKNYPTAMADAERLTAVRSRSALGRRLLAYVHGRMHNRDQALIEFNKAVELDPEDPITYRGRAWLYERMGRYDEHLADLDKALELDPDFLPTVESRGWAFFLLGRYDEVKSIAEQLLELDSKRTAAYGMLYLMYRNQGKIAELQPLIEKARVATRDWKEVEAKAGWHRDVAMGYAENGLFAKALAEADSAIALMPEKWSFYSSRASIHSMMQNQAGMQADCTSCAKVELDDPEEFYNRSWAMEQTCKNRDLAFRDINRAIELAPWWADAHERRAYFYRISKQWDLALADFNKAIELAPRWAGVYGSRAQLLVNQERFEEALQDYDRRLELGDDSPGLRNSRARVYLNLGRFDEAFAELDRVEELNPDKALADRWRSDCLYLIGRLDESLEAIDRALEKEPGDFFLHIWRAKVLLSLGRSCDEATAEMRAARGLTTLLNDTMKYWLAWHDLTYVANMCPGEMNLDESLRLAQESAQRDPTGTGSNGVYGLALYRAGRYAESIESFKKALEIAARPAATHVFSLSMAYYKNGQKGLAQETYNEGLKRMYETFPEAALIKLMRDEAAKVVGVGL